MFIFFVGREKKGQAAFSPHGFLRGGVRKTGTERLPSGRSVSARGGLEWKVWTTSEKTAEQIDVLVKGFIMTLCL
jgi:hypothetical protein